MSEDEKATLIDHVAGPYREPPGEDLSRILSLSDGIFAFAMTLLVTTLTGLSFVQCGNSCDGSTLLWNLGQNWTSFIAYVTVFFVIALYWTVHHRTFRYIERYDATLMWLNIVFLLCIAVMPFVLEVYNHYSGTPVAIVMFSGTAAATGFLMGAIWWHASGAHGLMDPKLDPKVIRYYRRRGFILPIVFVAVIPIAFVAPSIAGFCWVAAFPASAMMRRYGVA